MCVFIYIHIYVYIPSQWLNQILCLCACGLVVLSMGWWVVGVCAFVYCFDRESIVNSELSSWLSAPKKEAKGNSEKDTQEKDKKAA